MSWSGVAVWSFVPAAAGLACLALAVAVLLRPPLDRLQWSFALGLLAFAAQSVGAWALLAGADITGGPLVWLQLHGVAALAASLLWGLFVSVLIHRQTIIPIGWRVSLVAASVLVLGAAIVLVMADVFRIAPGLGP